MKLKPAADQSLNELFLALQIVQLVRLIRVSTVERVTTTVTSQWETTGVNVWHRSSATTVN
jgi:hypothetical protein